MSALSTKVMFPKSSPPPSAFMVTAAEKALADSSSMIFDPSAPVTKVAAPVIDRVPLSDMSPVVAVPLKVPPMVDNARSSPASLTIITAPELFGARVKDPSTSSRFNVIALLLASVVAVRLPPTVAIPVSVNVPPLSKDRSPSMVDKPMTKFVVPPSISTSASVPELSLVVISMAPVKALVIEATFRSIVASSALVTRVLVPVIVKAPLCVMSPVVAVALRFPPTVEAANSIPVSLTTVAAPLPFVLRAIVPSTSRVPILIKLPPASVVTARLPPTVTVPLSVTAPPAVIVKLPEEFEAPIAMASVSSTSTLATALLDEPNRMVAKLFDVLSSSTV